MRAVALVVSLLGLIVFGGAMAWSVVDPIGVERFARNIIKAEVEKRVHERIDSLDDTTIGRLAGRLAKDKADDISKVKEQIDSGLPARIAAQTAEMLRADCECRKIIGQKVDGMFAGTLKALTGLNERVTALIQTKYAEVTGLLMREFRIFTGANALVFGLLGAVTLARPKANLHLILPMIALLGGAALVGYFYIFHQNWLHTIVFSDYVGWWYFPWLGFAIAWMSDIFLNHGRVTVNVISSIPGSIADGLAIGPC